MHHLTLKKAVATYKDLSFEGQRTAIAADPKGFSEEDVNEILEAIKAEKNEPEKPKVEKQKRHIVSAKFRDQSDFNKKWEIGQDVSHFDKKRLEKLIELNLVKVL